MTQPDAPFSPLPEMQPEIALLSAGQICLLHNIRDDSALDEDFLASIRTQGILNRVIVKRGPCEHEHEYVAIAGHRRIQAEGEVRGVNSISVPVEIVAEDRELDVVFMLVENLQRKDIEPLEEGRAYAELVREHGWSQAEVAQSVGKSGSHVSERIALLGLTDKAKAMIANGNLPLRAAAKLTKLPHALVDEVLAQPGRKSEDSIEWDIKRAVQDAERDAEALKVAAQYAQEGWTVHRKAPAGATLVRLNDSNFGSGGLKLNMTVGKFKKEPGALVVIKRGSNYGSTKADVTYYTTDLARYSDGGANAAATAETPAKTNDEEQALKAEILEHRRDWFRTFVRGKVDNKVILERLTPVLWTSLVEREAVEMAEALGLFAADEESDQKLARERLRAHVEGKKIGEQLRICYLARFASELDAGLHRWDSLRVPQALLDAGYEPTALEQTELEAFKATNAAEWAEFRQMNVDDLGGMAEGNEMERFLAACSEAEANGDTPEDYDSPVIYEILDTWDQRDQDASVEEDEGEQAMTGGEAIGEEHAGE